MTVHPYRSGLYNSAILLSGDKTCFVLQSIGHGSFENTTIGITLAPGRKGES
jgi:hypothetical protein